MSDLAIGEDPLKIDEEALTLSAMEAVRATEPFQIKNVPSGLSLESSIGPAQGIDKLDRTPTPLPHPMIGLIQIVQESENIFATMQKASEDKLHSMMDKNKELFRKKEELLVEIAKSMESRDTWSRLATVSQYVAGIAAMSLASTCGGIPAALLYGSAVLGLTDRIATDTGLLQSAIQWYSNSKELQIEMEETFHTWSSRLSLGAGLAGGIGAVQAGALTAANGVLDLSRKLGTTVTSASQMIKFGTDLGLQFHQKQTSDSQADLAEVGSQMFLLNTEIGLALDQLNQMAKEIQSQVEEAHNVASNYHRSQR